MVENGIKPCYIFDGKPPELKGGVVSVFSASIPSVHCRIEGMGELRVRYSRENSSPSALRSERRRRKQARRPKRRVSALAAHLGAQTMPTSCAQFLAAADQYRHGRGYRPISEKTSQGHEGA